MWLPLVSAAVWLCLMFWAAVCEFDSQTLCPVSSQLNGTDYYIYPNNIYFADKGGESVPCKITDNMFRTAVLSCPVSLANKHCPVADIQNAFTLSSQWNITNSMCRIKEHLQNGDHMRVLVFGGSPAAGAKAQGCCKYDLCWTGMNKDNEDRCVECTWSKYVSTWMSNMYGPANVELINMARGGYSSYTTLHAVNLQSFNITSLSSKDIVFFDHSANDQFHHDSQSNKAVEALVRKILALSVSQQDSPTVILLLSDGRQLNRKLYSTGYLHVAKHYGLRLWSFYDAVQSMQRNDDVSKTIFLTLVLDKSVRIDRYHPAWHVHLYHADLVATAMRTELQQCRDPLPKITDSQPYVLPTPLHNISSFIGCRAEPVLILSYSSITHNHPVPVGTYLMDGGWKMEHDKHGGGFISEFTSNATCKDPKPTIVFKLSIDSATAATMDNLVLQIVFQKSYWNAGVVTMTYCGKEIGRIDALWEDRVTIPQIWSSPVPRQNCQDAAHPSEPAEIAFYHEFLDCDKPNIVEAQPRLNQMFKIESIRVCNSTIS